MALKGNQKKLDKNNNNRIDAQDFKILKAEKAKGRGQGLQDEKMKPGKPMKAALGTIALGLGAKKMKEKGNMMPMGIGAAGYLAKKKKEMLGKKKGGMFKGYSKVFETAAKAGQKNTGTSTIVGVKPNVQKQVAKSKRKTYKSMEEMRKAKGFKPGESAADFNKRKANEAFAKRAARATGARGKIALGVAAAGVAAYNYLKSKMKKEEPKKKMGGGMMQKYAVGGPAEQQRRMGRKKPSPGPLGKATGRRAGLPALPGKSSGKTLKQKLMSARIEGFLESTKDKVNPLKGDRVAGRGEKRVSFKPGEGATLSKRGTTGTNWRAGKDRIDKFVMSGDAEKNYKKTGKLFTNYSGKMSVGGSVTVKTKLGRNKPTKMY